MYPLKMLCTGVIINAFGSKYKWVVWVCLPYPKGMPLLCIAGRIVLE